MSKNPFLIGSRRDELKIWGKFYYLIRLSQKTNNGEAKKMEL